MWGRTAITFIVVVLLAIWLAALWFVFLGPRAPQPLVPKVLDPFSGLAPGPFDQDAAA
jgi:hypothetical protein